LAALGGMLTGPLVLSFWLPRRALGRLTVVRQIPAGIAAGSRLVVGLSATNRLRWLSAWTIEIEDTCRYDGPLAGIKTGRGQVLLPYLPPRAAAPATYEGVPPARGRYVFGPLRLTTFFPLGLVRHRRRVDATDELIVWPRLGRLTAAGLRLARHSDLAVQRTQRRQTRSEVDFHGLRDWRPGDSRRWIHWRSTARRGQIVVRQFDAARGQDVALFLDLFHPSPSGTLGADRASERVETALSLVATLVSDICRRGGSRLTLVVAGREPILLDGRSSAGMARDALSRLAVARPHARPVLSADFVEALGGAPPLCTILLISTRSVDLADLSKPGSSARALAVAARIKTITVDTPEMAQYFSVV
jgi:uncharacterized protein (DUF58 family)